jgi:hypothetical protein
VALDNNYVTWNNFGNDSWPADYLTPTSPELTPETYLGSRRADSYAGAAGTGTHTFSYPPSIPGNDFALSGRWSIGAEALTARKNAAVKLNFLAADVYLDVGGTGTITATADGKTATYKVSGAPDTYALVHRKTQERATLQVTLSSGLNAYSFTFG